MPAVSEKQRAWAFAVKGPAWARAHHFDTPGKLPAHVRKRRRPTTVAAALAKGGKR